MILHLDANEQGNYAILILSIRVLGWIEGSLETGFQTETPTLNRINEVFFWEETLLSFQDDVHLSRISFFKQAYRKNYCSSPETRYLFGKNVSFWLSSWKLLSFTQEWKFVFKWIVLHKRWTLLLWRITLKSILAVKVFVLF